MKAAFAFAATLGAALLTGEQALACNQGNSVCSFKLFNNTSLGIVGFQASPARQKSWESNIIPSGRVVKPGHEVNVNVSDGRPDCIYDFRVHMNNGQKLEKRAVNVCKLGTYTINE